MKTRESADDLINDYVRLSWPESKEFDKRYAALQEMRKLTRGMLKTTPMKIRNNHHKTR